jgi:putative SOS response-associated peptidase YedK
MTLDIPIEVINEIYGIVRRIDRELNPRYNVAPSQDVPIVRQDAEGLRELAFARWGLIPFWAKDVSVGYKMINARSETVSEKPSFRSAFKRRRCVIHVGGFYEWQATDGPRKKPWLFPCSKWRPDVAGWTVGALDGGRRPGCRVMLDPNHNSERLDGASA